MPNPKLKYKVCGLHDSHQLSEVDSLGTIDFLGLIFYPKSPRNFEKDSDSTQLKGEKIGVFVNSSVEEIKNKIQSHQLSYVQLHGDESPDFCRQLRGLTKLIKVFLINNQFDFSELTEYKAEVDYFLFDTASSKRGGSGKKFDWNKLNEYTGDTPFFLSGGISSDDAQHISTLNHPQLFALDLNSKFEISAGKKDKILIEKFINELN